MESLTSSLDATQGFIILGDAAYGSAGRSVSSAGDVNGDGFADLIVGAPYGYGEGGSPGEASLMPSLSTDLLSQILKKILSLIFWEITKPPEESHV